MAKVREYTYTNPLTKQPLTLTVPESNPNVAYAVNYLLNNGNNNKIFKDVSGMKQYFKDNDITYYPGMYEQASDILLKNGISVKELDTYYKNNPKNTDSNFTRSDNIIDVNIKNVGLATNNNVDSKNDSILTFKYIDPSTGEMREGTIGDSTAYNYTKVFTPNQTNSSVYYAIEYMLKNGQVDPNNKTEREALKSYLEAKTKDTLTNIASKNAIKDALLFFNTNDIPLSALGNNNYYSENSNLSDTVSKYSSPENVEQEEQEEQESAQEAAYNSYYRDIYDYNTEGTLGNEIYNNLWQAEQNAAMSNMQLAEAQYQQAAMDQAAVVKSITDQVRAERMAKLRSGMNEAQIANQDMQLMLNNMNTLNTQMNTLNQNRLAAQQQLNLAQDTAYQQYLQQAAALGQVGAAYAASDAGDAYMQTLKRMQQTGEPFNTANKYVTGQTSTQK